MSNVDINVDRRTDGLTDGRTDGQKIGRLYRTLLQAGAIKRTSRINIAVVKVVSIFLIVFMYNNTLNQIQNLFMNTLLCLFVYHL